VLLPTSLRSKEKYEIVKIAWKSIPIFKSVPLSPAELLRKDLLGQPRTSIWSMANWLKLLSGLQTLRGHNFLETHTGFPCYRAWFWCLARPSDSYLKQFSLKWNRYREIGWESPECRIGPSSFSLMEVSADSWHGSDEGIFHFESLHSRSFRIVFEIGKWE